MIKDLSQSELSTAFIFAPLALYGLTNKKAPDIIIVAAALASVVEAARIAKIVLSKNDNVLGCANTINCKCGS